jgi:BirA family biotin operon repressor/biotin-[acetyl-CoA-carboxylase] ligase
VSLSAPLTVDDIRSTLATKSIGHQIHVHQQLASTNSEAMSLAQAGAAHGTVVVADRQSAGRGRHARAWFSPPGTNVYCSIIARGISQGRSLSEWLSWVPLTSALAVAEAVQCVADLPLSLKWPNDLLLQERKVGGILCESSLASATDPIVVIGIGLNVNISREAFPEELRPIAASLLEASRQPIDRNHLIAQLLLELEQGLDELRAHGPDRLRRAYMTRCRTLGRRVRVLLGDEHELIGTAEAISADGALQVRPWSSSPGLQPASLVHIRAADVIHLRE